ncbi:hypothetical protein F511_05751 [Dorcoceras hygrometricum]|uniref:Uncharacterized protein n=1 Tax=Dorcoceras hygrometricum TaxID=472368 RepID=A0A2Z7DHF4_9LAMI|nr:hypothetical protein F511_05751 [Dorcoceras hygrometricum]
MFLLHTRSVSGALFYVQEPEEKSVDRRSLEKNLVRDLVKRKNDVALKENGDQLRRCEEKLNQLMKMNQTLREEKMKQLVRKDVNNSGVESAVEEVNKPDVVVQLLTYQMLINRGESAVGTTNSKTADEIYKEETTADERYEENQ